MKRMAIITAVVALTASMAFAEVRKESLLEVKLPNNEVLLPIATKPEARNGHIYGIETEKYGVVPPTEPGQKRSQAELIEALKNTKAGDLGYFERKETLWAISGRITDLGQKYLHEAAAEKLVRPEIYKGQLPGAIPNIKEGNVYLLETVDGKYALLRVLQMTPVGPQIQYVYQPNGTLRFDIPKPELIAVTPVVPMREEPLPDMTNIPRTPSSVGTTVSVMGGDPTYRPYVPPMEDPAVKANAPATPATPTTPPTITTTVAPSAVTETLTPAKPEPTVLEPYLGTHLRQRKMLIETRVNIVKSAPKTKNEVIRKVDAIAELGQLRAAEATDALIEQIDFMNTATKIKDFSIETYHPALGALVQIGKPSSKAALKALTTAPTDADAETRDLKQMLLIKVVRGVEGDDVAKLLIEKDVLPKVEGPRKAWLKDQLSKF